MTPEQTEAALKERLLEFHPSWLRALAQSRDHEAREEAAEVLARGLNLHLEDVERRATPRFGGSRG